MSRRKHMTWRTMIQAGVNSKSGSGYDPGTVKNAEEPYEFTIPEDRRFAAGCVIGDPCGCTGWKAIMLDPDVDWCWLGASRAVIVFLRNGKPPDPRHYKHDGLIPKLQDELMMPPPGTYVLKPVQESKRLGSGRNAKGLGTGKPNPHTGRRLSQAALLRSGYFNES